MLTSAGSFSVFLRRRWIVVLVGVFVFVASIGTAAAAEAGAGAGAATTENTAASVSSVAATCECQPLGPPGAVDSHLGTYLWTIVSTEWSDQDVIQEFQQGFAPIVTALPGFQRYTAATTGNITTVFFMTAFETAEQAMAAQAAVDIFVDTNQELKAAIKPWHFTQDHVVTGFPAGASCITEGSVGKFLATRLYEWTTPKNLTDDLIVSGTHFNDEIKGLEGYITYVGTLSEPDNRYTFVYNMYETEAVSIQANTMGQTNAHTNTVEVPPNTLLVSTQGEIQFDYLCAAGFTFSTTSTDKDIDKDNTASASAASSLVAVGTVYDFVATVFVTNSLIIVSSAIVDVLFA